MAKRPPTDYIKTAISVKTNMIKVVENDMNACTNLVEAEQRLVERARMLAYYINTLVGRDALTDNDVEMIVQQSKKAAGL